MEYRQQGVQVVVKQMPPGTDVVVVVVVVEVDG